MAALKQENSVNIDIDHLFQTIENLQIALKASSDAHQFAQEQARKDRVKFQDEVERICQVSNFKRFQLLEKIKYYEDQFASQLSPSKPQVTHQAQQTSPEDLLDDYDIDKTPSLQNTSTQTNSEAEVIDEETQTEPQPVKKIDSASSQTEEDQVVLSNMYKISNLESCLLKMEENQDLLLSELNIQRKNNFVHQEQLSLMRKKMADVTYANNLYHISMVEQCCSLPDAAEEILSSLSKGGQAEELHLSSIIQLPKDQNATSSFQKVQVDTKNIKEEQVINEHPEELLSSLSNGGQADDLHTSPIIQLSKKQDATYPSEKVQVNPMMIKEEQMSNQNLEEGQNISAMFHIKEDSTQMPMKETYKATSKELVWISRMCQALSKLEKKFLIPLEKRKPRMFQRKKRFSHIIPKPFRTIFKHLAAPEPEPVAVPDPFPIVDWSNVRFKPALPNPEDCPVYSASINSDVYRMEASSCPPYEYSTFTRKNPFGALPGYRTTEGIVSVPTSPVQGYVYSPEAQRWLLHASPVRRRTAGKGGPGTSMGEERRRKKPHYLP